MLLPELALQGPRSCLMSYESLRGELWSLEWATGSGLLNESEEGLPVSGLSKAVSSSWLWERAWVAQCLIAG